MPKGGKDDRHRCKKCRWSQSSFEELYWCDFIETYVDADYSCENYNNSPKNVILQKEETK